MGDLYSLTLSMRDAYEAALREDRAKSVLSSYQLVYLGGGLVDVIKPDGKIYHVDLLRRTCTCPDHTYRLSCCKHIIAARDRFWK